MDQHVGVVVGHVAAVLPALRVSRLCAVTVVNERDERIGIDR